MNGDKIIVSDCKNMPDYSSKVTSEVQLLTNQRAVTSDTIKCGPVVVKLPVVLAEVNVTIPASTDAEANWKIVISIGSLPLANTLTATM